ncbi:hypothetical protein SAMD00079811_27990 [Scytonema sp. HK-05]|uniref:hypothetical protein n=1 Tax=Scytonema sp. HK-05 TaxID=1137095 RepID=UPI0009365A36|nr:hypothetical protein [Scytonema sp. HK-05]OKH60882.1 hypothetical protein NIES2130_02050 [Scytonema sp. HK-05]BAY45197.1 hypothetical protein SAMD00079811_27990 [Scytonema sp. HK-05]
MIEFFSATLAPLIVILLFMAIVYAISRRTLGHEVAQRRLLRTALLLPLGFLFSLGFHSLGKYGLISFDFLFAAFVALWLLSWNWRKAKAGALLLNAGRLSVSKIIFWFGALEVLFTVLFTWSAINQISTGLESNTNLAQVISQLVFYWSLAIYLLCVGLSSLELRENGICYMFSVVKWEKLASYKWNEVKPNIVTISFKSPRLPLFRRFWSLPISLPYRDTVNRILAEHLMMAHVN